MGKLLASRGELQAGKTEGENQQDGQEVVKNPTAATPKAERLRSCAGHGAQRQEGAVNRGAKANREVTRRCKSSGGLGGRNP